jgi:hypothetical protein
MFLSPREAERRGATRDARVSLAAMMPYFRHI